jgi:hypothetical protein
VSTSKTPLERYTALIDPKPAGRPHCFGWKGAVDRYGLAKFTWTQDGSSKSGNAARWLWEHHRGALGPDQALRNTCGWSACQRLGHWKVVERPRGLSPQERYESRIDRSGGPEACHEWQQTSRDKNGYGILSWRENGKSVTRRAHRFGWELLHGPIEDGLGVLHTCDNPPCQNPSHWFLGTNADNMADMKAKGRGTGPGSGEKHPRAKLTNRQVAEARARFTGERGQISALAREYGIAPRSMGHILHGERR